MNIKHPFRAHLLLLFLGLLTVSCSDNSSNIITKPDTEKSKPINMVASYYGDDFNGKKTANGEIFDSNALTAAHKSYPFNTKLKVTNLKNGKSVIVRVNDRGPHVKGRQLDLSKQAAILLGIEGAGVSKVAVTRIDGG